MAALSSKLLVGNVRHRRFTPKKHELSYSLFMPCIDLDEWPALAEKVWGVGDRWWHWARFNRNDYLGQGALKQSVQQKVYELTGNKVEGKVLAVIHLRYLGVYFSPVNFYYLYDTDGEWRYLLAEVSNTPWNERHYYAIPAEQGDDGENWRHEKAFHVSPFNPVDQQYQWRLKPITDSLMVHLECHKQGKVFDATLAMKAQEFSSKSLFLLLVKTPIMAVKMTAGIYWHAFKLWVKGVPVYDHPNNKTEQKQKSSKENTQC